MKLIVIKTQEAPVGSRQILSRITDPKKNQHFHS